MKKTAQSPKKIPPRSVSPSFDARSSSRRFFVKRPQRFVIGSPQVTQQQPLSRRYFEPAPRSRPSCDVIQDETIALLWWRRRHTESLFDRDRVWVYKSVRVCGMLGVASLDVGLSQHPRGSPPYKYKYIWTLPANHNSFTKQHSKQPQLNSQVTLKSIPKVTFVSHF